MSLTEELQKLQELYQAGVINDDEFASAKAKLINEFSAFQNTPYSGNNTPQMATVVSSLDPDKVAGETRMWSMLLHFSVLAGYVAPGAGLVAPIVIWQVKKSELPGIDEHGKNTLNWILSFLIYSIISFLCCFILIGFPMLIALMICGIVFPIIAGIKANNGETWKYPLAIKFIT